MRTSLALFLVLAGACSKEEPAAVSPPAPQPKTYHGTWQTRDADGDMLVLVLKSDGTGSFEAEPLTYKLDGGRLTIDVGGAVESFDMTFDGKTLTLRPVTYPEPMVFTRAPESSRNVVVNRKRVSDADVAALERAYRVRVMDGAYWYDPVSGAWGLWGGPVAGQILPGLTLGGPLPENASGGDTGVTVNGRELHKLDVAALRQFTQVVPGRYWVDAQGNGGVEGQPATFNLFALAQRAGGKNPWTWRSKVTDIGAGGDGNGFVYVIGKDFSVSVDR